MPLDLAADEVVGEFTLTAIQHHLTACPGSVIFFQEILDTYKDDDTKHFFGIFDQRPNGNFIRLTTTPIDLDRRIFDEHETGTGYSQS